MAIHPDISVLGIGVNRIIFKYLRPRELTRLKLTSRWYLSQVESYTLSEPYSRVLLKVTADQYYQYYSNTHRKCFEDLEWCDIAAHIDIIRDEYYAVLVGDIAENTQLDILKILYPVAMGFTENDIRVVPYLIEWCGRREYTITGAGTGPRYEVLALLHTDPFVRISQLVKQADPPNRRILRSIARHGHKTLNKLWHMFHTKSPTMKKRARNLHKSITDVCNNRAVGATWQGNNAVLFILLSASIMCDRRYPISCDDYHDLPTQLRAINRRHFHLSRIASEQTNFFILAGLSAGGSIYSRMATTMCCVSCCATL